MSDRVVRRRHVRHLLYHSFIRHPTEAAAGWTTAFGVLGEHLRPMGTWIAGHETSTLGIERSASMLRMIAVYSELLQKKFRGVLGPTGDDYIEHTVAGAA